MSKRSININIKGIKWKFRVLTDRSFTKKYHDDHDTITRGITIPDLHLVDFRLSEFKLSLIIHELSHVYYTSCLNSDIEPTVDQVEETLAKIWEMHYDEVGVIANLIFNTLKKE